MVMGSGGGKHISLFIGKLLSQQIKADLCILLHTTNNSTLDCTPQEESDDEKEEEKDNNLTVIRKRMRRRMMMMRRRWIRGRRGRIMVTRRRG